MYYNTDLYRTTSSINDASVWTVVSILVALCAAIVLFFTFLNPKNAEHYTGTTKKIYDFLSFKVMSLESILKICYLFVAIYITISSFSYISTSVIAFIVVLIVGNVVARLVFESALLILMIHKRLMEISEKMPTKDEKKKEKKVIEEEK